MLLQTDDTWLVEIRFGRTKWRIRELVQSIARTFHVEDVMERHPHVTLYGPFTLRTGVNPREILSLIGNIAKDHTPVAFTIDGWEKREGMHGSVIAFTVYPSDDFRILTTDISRALHPVVESLNAWDGTPELKWFHSTITNRMDAPSADLVFSGLSGTPQSVPEPILPGSGLFDRVRDLFARPKESPVFPVYSPPLLDETGLRITVLNGEHIYAEYDLIEKRWILAGHDHESLSWQRTLQAFRYRSGFELRDPVPSTPDTIFVISDLHLGHANIIRYCSRPFLYSDVQEMDHVLIKNWNYTISPLNRVFHLGDLRYGREAPLHTQYRKKLHGQITWVTGNHDEHEPGGVPSVRMEYDGRQFLLIHDPADVPPDFDGWVIHGHHHNNDLRHYPFINFSGRRINVSAEVTGYVPVSLGEIAQLIRQQEISGNTTPLCLRHPQVS